MTKREWGGIAAAITALWPSADLSEATVLAWYEVLRDAAAEPIRKAVMDIHLEGREFPPTAGELHQHAKASSGPYTGPPCTCHVGGRRGCRSTAHTDAFEERQRVRDQAVALVDAALARGEVVDPAAYPGELGRDVGAVVLQRWYDANAAAGRAINDPGDEQGNPTKPPPCAQRGREHVGAGWSRQAVRERDLPEIVGRYGWQLPTAEEGGDGHD